MWYLSTPNYYCTVLLPFAPRLLFFYLALPLHAQASSWLELTPSWQMIIVTPVLFLSKIHFVPYCSVDVLSNRYIIHMHRHKICSSTSMHEHTHPDTPRHTLTHVHTDIHTQTCTYNMYAHNMNIHTYNARNEDQKLASHFKDIIFNGLYYTAILLKMYETFGKF